MTNLKSLALAAVIGLGFVGTASAQVFPGVAGTPGRGNSNSVAVMPNGGIVSNGYLAEPTQFRRGPVVESYGFQNGALDAFDDEELPMRGSPNSPNTYGYRR